ncbi:hypothetical protein H5410_058560 [Solanum commersonii]|uniref:Uncharacterized protein n=1 Tax=Solanum commersonii TaxID=4109 RepID=A0A9J5WRY0_SOLCO|nr:hypothetical protein H5410_058560 [Solanum commersonii]
MLRVITVDFPQKKVTLVQDGSRLLEFRMVKKQECGSEVITRTARVETKHISPRLGKLSERIAIFFAWESHWVQSS